MPTADQVTQSIDKTLESASAFGGNVFLATLVLVLMFVFVGGFVWVYLKWVIVPDRESRRKIEELNSQTIAAMGNVVQDTHKLALDNFGMGTKTWKLARRMQLALRECAPVIESLAAKAGVDVRKEMTRLETMLLPGSDDDPGDE